MDTGDVLYRVSGGAMVVSGLFNLLIAGVYILSLIWVCVGIYWLLPGALALVQVLVGIGMIATGKSIKPMAFAPALGFLTSALNLNFFNFFFDLVAIGLGIAGFVVVNNQPQLEDSGR